MPRPLNFNGRSRLLKKALLIFGGHAGLGRKLGLSRQRVHQWSDVPQTRRKAIRDLIAQSNAVR